MYVPSILNRGFSNSFLDDFFSFPFDRKADGIKLMSTDVQELGNNYQLEMELPGFAKSDIKAELNNGYLSIEAKKEEAKDKKDENGKYLRRERYQGSCKRSFYVGKNLKEEDIQASFENGILKLVFPKEDQRNVPEEKKYIAIE